MIYVQNKLFNDKVWVNIPEEFEQVSDMKIQMYHAPNVYCAKSKQKDLLVFQQIKYRDKMLSEEITSVDYGFRKSCENFEILSRKSRMHNEQEQYLTEYHVEREQNHYYVCVLLIQTKEMRFVLTIQSDYNRKMAVENYSRYIFDSIKILETED